MLYKITIFLQNKSLEIELDDSVAPITVRAIVNSLPISVDVHVWGQEIYTDPIPIKVREENSQSLVNLYDVAYWLPGQSICLFFGPTPIGNKGEIKPYSPVNVIGKIISKDVKIPINLDGKKITLGSSC